MSSLIRLLSLGALASFAVATSKRCDVGVSALSVQMYVSVKTSAEQHVCRDQAERVGCRM
jgi:hypothetical protein